MVGVKMRDEQRIQTLARPCLAMGADTLKELCGRPGRAAAIEGIYEIAPVRAKTLNGADMEESMADGILDTAVSMLNFFCSAHILTKSSMYFEIFYP